ncbi:MAG TPA: 30S ribosomal protein S24e [Candidatus Deferrimicrobium sp.]|nr:30S ribosomal protein S24e [Candidatus Deferrimicrobium sp.]
MSLKIIITKEFENPLLNRKRVNFKILHQKMPTPSRIEVRKTIAAQYNVDLETIFIEKLETKYGQPYTVGLAKIYSTPEKAQQNEKKYVIKRHKLEEKEKSD